jgi:hypothetical protein
MGCKVALAVFPLECGVRTSRAVPSRRKFGAAVASVAVVDRVMAGAAVKGTALLGHKHALRARLYGCTVHGNHPLSQFVVVSSRCCILAQFGREE